MLVCDGCSGFREFVTMLFSVVILDELSTIGRTSGTESHHGHDKFLWFPFSIHSSPEDSLGVLVVRFDSDLVEHFLNVPSNSDPTLSKAGYDAGQGLDKVWTRKEKAIEADSMGFGSQVEDHPELFGLVRVNDAEVRNVEGFVGVGGAFFRGKLTEVANIQIVLHVSTVAGSVSRICVHLLLNGLEPSKSHSPALRHHEIVTLP